MQTRTQVLTQTATVVQTVTNTTATATRAFAPRLTKVAAARHAGSRLVALTLDVDRSATARIQLVRRGHSILTRVVHVQAGRRAVSIPVPHGTKAGSLQVVIRIASGSDVRTLTSHVTIGR